MRGASPWNSVSKLVGWSGEGLRPLSTKISSFEVISKVSSWGPSPKFDGPSVTEEDERRCEMRNFILVWKDGKREQVSGNDIADAYSRAGLGAGALGALDHFEELPGLVDPKYELFAVRAFLAVVEERIACYGVFGNDELRRTWLRIRDKVKDGEESLCADSQAGDLFAKVYKQMCLPTEEYERIFSLWFKR
jgi:hypothetical protein